jgi:hypothetical protein
MQIFRVKAVVAVASLTAALGGIGVLAASTASAGSSQNPAQMGNLSPHAAFVVSGFPCGVPDANFNPVPATQSHEVITSSSPGVDTVTCSGQVAPPGGGTAVRFEGFLCGTSTSITTDSMAVVSASGQVTLTCRSKL